MDMIFDELVPGKATMVEDDRANGRTAMPNTSEAVPASISRSIDADI
jgi:hypothetical protein